MNAKTNTPNLDNWLRASGVRNDDTHALRVDRTLALGARERRNWRCTCGKDFGSSYDSAAKAAYRVHRKAAN